MTQAHPSQHLARRIWREPQVRRGALLGISMLCFALLGPWVTPYSVVDMPGPVYGGPDANAILGYDFLGHDVWSRLLAGGWTIMWMSLAASSIALLAGTILGVLAGFSRKRLDQAITWIADVALAFPDFILVLLIISMLGRQPWLIVLIVAITFTPSVIRLARSSTVAIASQEFVELAKMMGFSHKHILLREIVPNILTPLLVHFGNMLTWSVALLSGLSFLGYGVAPPAADWGLMINENLAGFLIQPWAVLAPAAMIAVFAYAANILAEGISRSNARTDSPRS